MIEGAVILSGLVRHWLDFAIIVLLLVSNAVAGFWEEHQARNAIAALQAKLATTTHVRREGRAIPTRFHMRGYEEEGTTTTPFDMVVLNETSRYHICIDAIRCSKRPVPDAHARTADCLKMLERQSVYLAEHLEDLPEIANWAWPRNDLNRATK